jgi:ribosomal protein S18 acetylase RimI-like enzyme
MRARRTYLEMTAPTDLRPATCSDPAVRLDRIDECEPQLYRHLYTKVGGDYHWIDRLSWTDADIVAHLADPTLSLHVLIEGDQVAGYFELKRQPDGGIEIAYFGLMPQAIGRGLGKCLLTLAVEEAWRSGASRVWLHTSTLDHPHALANYLARGFRVFKSEEYEFDDDA